MVGRKRVDSACSEMNQGRIATARSTHATFLIFPFVLRIIRTDFSATRTSPRIDEITAKNCGGEIPPEIARTTLTLVTCTHLRVSVRHLYRPPNHHHHFHYCTINSRMIRRSPTSLSVQESDVETLKAHRRAKMMQHNPNLTASSFSSIRPNESGSIHDSHHGVHHHPYHHHAYHHHHHHHHHAREGSDEQDDPGTQPGLSQQENHNPNQAQNGANNT